VSAAFVPFLYALRAQKLRVGPQEALALAEALKKELHDVSLTGFYHVARALFVHRESELDAFDQAFASHFRGVPMQSLALIRELEDWLKDPLQRKELTPEELAALEQFSFEQLKQMLEERMRDQKERHDGGNRWVGSGGTSPFGQHGAHPSGVRVGGSGGGRSALGVADARKYKPYRSDLVLDVRQVEVALRKLRAFTREGQIDELDLERTVEETGRNAGELEIVLRAPRRSNVRIVLLMDVGGSMDPYAHTVSLLFSAAKKASNIRALKTYYFHNCIYGHVFETESLREPVKISDLTEQCGPEWKLVVVGDAAMHPAELLGSGDWMYYARGGAEQGSTGLSWLHRLSDHYKKSVWLNPDPPNYWKGGTADQIARVFSMYQLTVESLGEAVAHLSRGTTKAK
jgi:uncharacterized protein